MDTASVKCCTPLLWNVATLDAKAVLMGFLRMYGNPQKRNAAEVQDLRREGGRWLKGLRDAAGLSQRELASAVHADYYTFISQLETGRGRIPPDRYVDWAKALRVPEKVFVRETLRYYDPITYGILFAE